MRMRRSEGKAESTMLVARREVARHEIGSELVKGKGAWSVDVRFESEEAPGIGPACERSSKWMYSSVGELKSGIAARDVMLGALY